jgi:hypothetical protein
VYVKVGKTLLCKKELSLAFQWAKRQKGVEEKSSNS